METRENHRRRKSWAAFSAADWMLVNFRDISKRKQAEGNLREYLIKLHGDTISAKSALAEVARKL